MFLYATIIILVDISLIGWVHFVFHSLRPYFQSDITISLGASKLSPRICACFKSDPGECVCVCGGFKCIVQLKFANNMVKVKQVQVQYTVWCMYGVFTFFNNKN